MSEHLHTVTITGDEDHPRIEFVCVGEREADCHRWPECDCVEWWDYERDEECGHIHMPHESCWVTNWFARGDTDPSAETLAEANYRVGMSGPISVTTCEDNCCVEWEFTEEANRG